MEIGVCGWGYTGSTALTSLLREFENTTCINGDIEFVLPYTPDGIEDLEYNLITNPSKGVRCDTAIFRFNQMLKVYKRSFNRSFNGKFTELSKEYIDSLVQVSWKAYRVFELEMKGKNLERVIRGKLKVLLNKVHIDLPMYPITERYFSINPPDFYEKSRKYIRSLLREAAGGDYKCFVLDQPFSISNPLNSFKYFDAPKCIMIDRDPRDLYVMLKKVYGTYGMFIPTDTVENFIDYYILVRDNSLYRNAPNILKINFEELVYNYEGTIKKVESFLDGELGGHINKCKYFRPEESVKNTYVYPRYPDIKEDIAKITKKLEDYLFPFEKYKAETSLEDLNKFTHM